MNSVKIEFDLPLVVHNNISKFRLIWLGHTQVIAKKPKIFTILYFIKGHNSGMSKVKSVKIELDLPLVIPNNKVNISKFHLIWLRHTQHAQVIERKPKILQYRTS